jgi:hypothetical protein
MFCKLETRKQLFFENKKHLIVSLLFYDSITVAQTHPENPTTPSALRRDTHRFLRLHLRCADSPTESYDSICVAQTHPQNPTTPSALRRPTHRILRLHLRCADPPTESYDPICVTSDPLTEFCDTP